MEGALRDVRVLELGDFVAAPYAGKLLADMGAVRPLAVADLGVVHICEFWCCGTVHRGPSFSDISQTVATRASSSPIRIFMWSRPRRLKPTMPT